MAKVYRHWQEPVVLQAVQVVPDADSTKDEIKAYLDEQGVEYTSRMTKDELLELI